MLSASNRPHWPPGLAPRARAQRAKEDARNYTLSDPSGNIFCVDFARGAKDAEWPGYDRLTEAGESTITYDPFGDGADANMWATSFTTNSSNPIQKQAGF